jgi:membrane protease YdiL (CAAX protease family)
MSLDGLIPALSAALNACFLIVGVYVYTSLLRQIGARTPDIEAPPLRTFGRPEAILATVLTLFFLLTISGPAQHISRMENQDLIYSAVLTMGLLLALAGFLRLRRFDLDSLGGFSRIGFFRTAVTGGVLILAAFPLILLADVVTQRFLQREPARQAIVEMFSQSTTLEQRILIILLAVSLAPLAEEFIFRFFLYGVAKRYFGRTMAIIVSSLLFAAVHSHLPSFAPLFVLGSCFAIAYEWSGSIIVPMVMHALFNAFTLTALAFPEFGQS